MMKKVLSIFLSITVMLTMLTMPVQATNQPTVTVQSIEESTAIGGEVKLEVSVANNPGFTNFDWTVKYDTERLELKDFETIGKVEIPGYGTFDKVYLPNFSIANNIETGKISVGNQATFTDNGTLFCVIFTVKESAPSGKAKVSIVSENIKNDGVPVVFTYVTGTVNVDGIDCDEGHDYGDGTWQIRTKPTCEKDGEKFRICKREGCCFEETEVIPSLGHAYGDFVYVDEKNHKQVCANDADHIVIEEHKFNENQYCPICKYQGEVTGGSTTGGSTTGGSTTGGSTTGGSTTGGSTTGKEIPSIGETITGWEDIKIEISNSTQETITVDMNGAKEVPAEVFEKMAEADATVEFNMDNGISWTIKADESTSEEISFSEINLDAQLNVTTIPEDVVEEVEAEEKIQLELAHNGEFVGLTMTLNINLGSEKAGKWANLYYFNTATNSLEWQVAVEVDENGNVEFSLDHASNYVIAIDDASHSTGGSTTGGSTTGGSTTGGSTTGGSTTGGSTTGGSTTGGSTTGGSTTGGSTTGGSTTGGSTTGGSTTGGSTTGGSTTGGSTTGGSTTGGSTTGGSTTGGSTTGGSTTGGSTTGGSTTGGSTTGGSTTGGSTTGGSTTGGSTTGGSTTGGSTTGGSTTGGSTTGGSTTGGCESGNHDIQYHSAQPQTCEGIGWDAYETCSRCTYSTYVELPALGHSYGNFVPDDENNHKKVCANNNTHIITEAHTWDTGVVTKQPTYREKGEKTHTCPVCLGTKKEDIPKLISYDSGVTTVSKYTVRFNSNGGSAVASKIVEKGDIVAMPAAPMREGYKFVGWYIDADLTNVYDFSTKISKSFTLYAKWEEVKEPETDKPNTTKEFKDIKTTDWYYEAVKYVSELGLMTGVKEGEFAAELLVTRAMLVTILYRNEGEPAVNKSIPFVDIDMNAYYANAVIWAHQNGIVKGISETKFAPDRTITREQIITMLFRYAQYKGMDTITLEENLGFADAHEISEYAVTAMNWAVGNNLIKGRTEDTIHPRDYATRAEFATLLYRFLGLKF